jgi:uncharacterized protein (DUF1697 family)
MPVHVALLRGINVGGRNKVAMKELRSLFASLGHQDVRTYVTSGNVVFTAPSEPGVDHAPVIEEAIAAQLALDVSVVMRTPSDLAAVAGRNPFASEEDPSKVHVVFLRRSATAEAAGGLDPDRSPPDEFVVDGRETFIHYPNGAGRSKLTLDYFERRLGSPATARNLRTVTELIDMAGAR